MLWRERLHTIERELELEVDRLLRPERAIVVERGDAVGGRYELGRARARHARDEFNDALLVLTVLPRGKWILRNRARRRDRQYKPESRRTSRRHALPPSRLRRGTIGLELRVVSRHK